LTGRPEDLTVRAIAIEAGGHTVELASVDGQGWFAGYAEGPYGISDVRRVAAAFLRAHGAPSASPADIIVSSLHEHAVPSTYGIYAPAAHQLGYLKQLAAATTRALEEAYQRAVPATLTAGHGNAPWLGGGDIPEGNEFEGWRRDGSLLALWARNAVTGATIATYVDEPAYPNIVFGPADLMGPAGSPTLISGDFPGYAEAMIEQRLGGTAVLATGSLANQASPMQADIAPSPDLPKVDGRTPTRAFDDILHMAAAVTNVAFGALAAGHTLTDPVVGGAEQYIVSPVANPAVLGLAAGNEVDGSGTGAWAPVAGLTTIYPTDRSFVPPYGAGAVVGTWVTALRVGDVALISEPGEFFGSIRAAWATGIHAPGGVFAVGAAQDFLGYEYPVGTTPFTLLGGDELIFGPSPTLGDQVVTAGEQGAAQLGFPADLTANAEVSALDQQYSQVARAGAYLLPSATAGDLDPATGRFTPVLLAAGAPPRTTMTCDSPALIYSPPGCPVTAPPVPGFHWRFGDGTTATTPVEGRARASFSPFVSHAYDRPGTYRVSVAVTTNGSTDRVSLPVTVHPALQVAVGLSGGVAVAHVSGGDGHALYERWTLPGGSVAFGPRAAVPGPGTITLTVVDGTGTMSTAATTAPVTSVAGGSGGPSAASATGPPPANRPAATAVTGRPASNRPAPTAVAFGLLAALLLVALVARRPRRAGG
jgi:hypothetical protein